MRVAAPEREGALPPAPAPERSGGWFRKALTRVKLLLEGGADQLVVENATALAWRLYQDYHQLAIIDPGERRTFHLVKKGILNMRPFTSEIAVEYLFIELSLRVHYVRIYARSLGPELETYDLRVA